MDVNNFTASDVAKTCLVGVLIVFAVLAVIWVCLAIMERVFRKGEKKSEALAVTAPFDGVVISVRPLSEAREGEAVLTVIGDDDSENDILSPASGRILMRAAKDDRVKKGETLFTIE